MIPAGGALMTTSSPAPSEGPVAATTAAPPDQATGGGSDAAAEPAHCPWCSAVLPACHGGVCPSCGATLEPVTDPDSTTFSAAVAAASFKFSEEEATEAVAPPSPDVEHEIERLKNDPGELGVVFDGSE